MGSVLVGYWKIFATVTCTTSIITILSLYLLQITNGVRLHKLFQFIDGYRAEFDLQGYLHVGNEYAVFLRAPKPHDKYLIYELYEAKNVPDIDVYKPRLLAISKVPVAYIKSQLKIFRNELYKAKFVDDTFVPGVQVKTLREWQIERALKFNDNQGVLDSKSPVLRTIL